jgi:hypothetical protein
MPTTTMPCTPLAKRGLRSAALAAVVLFSLEGCGQDAQEAPRVEVPVHIDGARAKAVTTDLGYEVELDAAEVALRDIEFTVAGEVHTASFGEHLWRLVVGKALAHPGHYQGGEVTGELLGTFIVDWLGGDGDMLGTATLLPGTYRAVNFTLERAARADVPTASELIGHTAHFRGTARKAGETTRFEAFIDSPEGRQIVGVPFEANVTKSFSKRAVFGLVLRDPEEDDTLFDGLDFAALPAAEDGLVSIAPDAEDPQLSAAYDLLRRTFQTHDHFVMTVK